MNNNVFIWKIAVACFGLASCLVGTPSQAQSAASGTCGILQQGQASWYGPGFHGRRTASGERFNSGDFTAAHRTLPFGIRVRVVNERADRSVVVRINDRRPYAHGRMIDLSCASAQALGVSGVATVALSQP